MTSAWKKTAKPDIAKTCPDPDMRLIKINGVWKTVSSAERAGEPSTEESEQ